MYQKVLNMYQKVISVSDPRGVHSKMFEQESFFSELLIIIKRKKTYQLVIDEGWYSESELKELGWTQHGS